MIEKENTTEKKITTTSFLFYRVMTLQIYLVSLWKEPTPSSKPLLPLMHQYQYSKNLLFKIGYTL